MQVCYNCKTTLSIRIKIHFCPFCGKVQINNKLINNINTNNYDPKNPKPWRYRPWKDLSKIPCRNYIIENKTNIPWIAVMKNPTRNHNNNHNNNNRFKNRFKYNITNHHDDGHIHQSYNDNGCDDSMNQQSVIINVDDDNNDDKATGKITNEPDVLIECKINHHRHHYLHQHHSHLQNYRHHHQQHPHHHPQHHLRIRIIIIIIIIMYM